MMISWPYAIIFVLLGVSSFIKKETLTFYCCVCGDFLFLTGEKSNFNTITGKNLLN